jgi:hypothetical protein
MKKTSFDTRLLAFSILAILALMSFYPQVAVASYIHTPVLSKSTCISVLGGTWSGSTCFVKNADVNATTDLAVPSGIFLRVKGTLTIDGELDNQGNVTDNSKLLVSSGGLMVNQKAARVTINTKNGTLAISSKGNFSNTGTLLDNSKITVDGNFTNEQTGVVIGHGNIVVDSSGTAVNKGILLLSYGGVMGVTGVFNNYGTVYVFTKIGSYKSGIISNKAGGFFVLFKEGTIFVGPPATFNNAGTITASGADGGDNTIVNSGTFTNTGTILNNGGFANWKTGTFTNSGTFRNRGTFRNPGTFVNSAHSLMTNPGNVYSLGTITNYGNITSTGYFQNTGKFNTVKDSFVFNYGIMSNRIAYLTNNGNLTNAGTLLNTGTFTNQGKWDNTQGIFDNSGGAYNIGTAATVTIQPNASFLNRIGGTLSIESGLVTNDGALFNRGITTVQSGATLTNNGIIFNPTATNLVIQSGSTYNQNGIVLPWD